MQPLRPLARQLLGRINIVLLFLCMISVPVLAQSKYREALDGFQHSGDFVALQRDIVKWEREKIDLKAEIPVVMEMISNSDSRVSSFGEAVLFTLAMKHPFAFSSPNESIAFLPAVAACHAHAAEALADENSLWTGLIVAMTAYSGFQPDVQELGVIYRWAERPEVNSQGLALIALARIRPIPAAAKDLFKSRITKTAGKLSGFMMLGNIALALPDPDIIEIFIKSAEVDDVVQQRFATKVLALMNPMPPPVTELFRRLETRNDLDSEVRSTVQQAVTKLERQPR